MRTSIFLGLGAFGWTISLGGCGDRAPLMPRPSTQAAQAIPNDYVATPAGWYHRSCVHEIESGATVERSGLLVRRKDKTTYKIAPCVYAAYRNRRPGEAPSTGHAWIEYASTSQPAGSAYSQLNANWTVPYRPVFGFYTGSTEVYYSFPGLQNFKSPSDPFILQPVIGYGANGAGGSATAWTMASWRCDTSSGPPGCTYSTPVTITAGDAIYGTVAASNCSAGNCTWTVTTQDQTTGQRTIGTWVDDQNYSWATGGAVEVWNIDFNCDQYPVNGVNFSGISLFDQNLTQLSPSWSTFTDLTVTPQCNFGVPPPSPSAVTLLHNPGTVIASGGLTASGVPHSCTSPYLVAVTASGTNVINLRDACGHTGTMSLSGVSVPVTASGGLTAYVSRFCGGSRGAIATLTASGTNAITVQDDCGHTGAITLSSPTVAASCIPMGPPPGVCGGGLQLVSVTGYSNSIQLVNSTNHSGYLRVSQ
jgi:hypothetical protein